MKWFLVIILVCNILLIMIPILFFLGFFKSNYTYEINAIFLVSYFIFFIGTFFYLLNNLKRLNKK